MAVCFRNFTKEKTAPCFRRHGSRMKREPAGGSHRPPCGSLLTSFARSGSQWSSDGASACQTPLLTTLPLRFRLRRMPHRGTASAPRPRRICLSPFQGLRPTVRDGHARHCRASHFLAHWASASLSPSANAPLGHRSAPAPGRQIRKEQIAPQFGLSHVHAAPSDFNQGDSPLITPHSQLSGSLFSVHA